MLSHIARRLLAALPVMAFVALFVFGLLYLAPGDPAAVMAGDQATAADIARIRIALKLDDPFPIRFGNWVWSLLHGDLGLSLFTNQPVAAMIVQRLEPTYLLMLMTLVVSVTLALPIGVIAAWKHNTTSDRAVMVFAVLSFSVPSFVVGYLLAFVFGLQLRWLPVQGYVPMSNGLWPAVRSLILPAVALGSVYIGLLARITRATMLEVLAHDYVRTARAKGLAEEKVILKHALRNALTPVITLGALEFGTLLSGAVLTEQIFSVPGFGKLIVDAVFNRDYAVVQGVVLVTATTYVVLNLLADIGYIFANPRLRS